MFKPPLGRQGQQHTHPTRLPQLWSLLRGARQLTQPAGFYTSKGKNAHGPRRAVAPPSAAASGPDQAPRGLPTAARGRPERRLPRGAPVPARPRGSPRSRGLQEPLAEESSPPAGRASEQEALSGRAAAFRSPLAPGGARGR